MSALRKILCISHVNSHFMKSSKSDEENLMIEPADHFMKNLTESTTFPMGSFCIAAKAALTELRRVYAQYENCTQRSSYMFLAVKLQIQPHFSR